MTSPADDTIVFIGGGNMARAIAAGLVDGGFDAHNVVIAEPSQQARDDLAARLPGAKLENDNARAAAQAASLVLAVKPQVLPAVCRELAATVQARRPLVISVAAGVRSADIDAWLGGGLPVVRVMPNQPALVRDGVAGLFANARVSAPEHARARSIMEAVGRVIDLDDEADLDTVTAISGSGPAYFFLLIDMLEQAARDFGLPADAARELAVGTAHGSAALAVARDADMAALIARVRSPGGTTAAALDALDAAGVRAIFATAIAAARDRAAALADEAHRNPAE